MALQYFKRFRMEIDLGRPLPPAVLPADYLWVAWRGSVAERHALVKYRSFCGEVDAQVFPCLADLAGCRRLMSEIAGQRGFLPQATWLIAHRARGAEPSDCGTIQGVRQTAAMGAVQNVGVSAEHRGLGLGRALVLKSLAGFQAARLKRVYLEVTASNQQAVELYRSVGFQLARTMYRAVRVEPARSV